MLNEENEFVLEAELKTEGPIETITEEEVRTAMRKSKSGKAPGPTGVTCEMFQNAGDVCLTELATVYQDVLSTGKITDDWKQSTTIPIFEGRGDALQCEKYRASDF